jgi:hypothetical protein
MAIRLGFMIFLGWLPRLTLSLAILLVPAAWAATQNLGGILTGSSTDVGTGPVWVLLAVAFWPAARVSAGGAGDPALTARRDSPAAGTGTTARSGERP